MHPCTWTNDGEAWRTSCGHYFTLIDGAPTDNKMRFCCYCGKAIEATCEESLQVHAGEANPSTSPASRPAAP